MKIKNKTEFLSDLKQMSVREVSLKYHLCISSVYKYKQRYGLNVYFSDNVPADFTEYAKTHNKLQAKEHYNTSYSIIRKWERLANYTQVGTTCQLYASGNDLPIVNV